MAKQRKKKTEILKKQKEIMKLAKVVASQVSLPLMQATAVISNEHFGELPESIKFHILRDTEILEKNYREATNAVANGGVGSFTVNYDELIARLRHFDTTHTIAYSILKRDGGYNCSHKSYTLKPLIPHGKGYKRRRFV